jgi:predicted ATPase/class 3 adenylate cyclase
MSGAALGRVWCTGLIPLGVPMAGLPTGTVTFLFTDLEGSTRLWEEHPEAMRDALARHDAILREAVESHRGVVFSEMGDGMAAAFASAGDAVAAGLDAQLGLWACEWGQTGPLRARMGLHAGEGEVRPDGQYVNQPLNRCARLMAIANGGQVVVSETVESLVRGALPRDVGLLDLGEHRLRDLALPIGVFQVTHPVLPRDFPPLRSLDVLPGNLPVQVTSFVGREQDLERVAATLAEARVVTLTGVGGVGKTRLALQVAGEMSLAFRDGTWLCELAGVRDPEAVADAIVALFQVEPRQGVSVAEALVEFLRAKQLLLVLDNCEHLLKPVARLVADIERACPSVRVLATSREGLNVAGEHLFVVSSLEVPDPGADLDVVSHCEAVRLFVDRARAVKADFVLDAANAGGVAQVCRRVDGIALAIELAAARVTMLTPVELARRLDQRFRVLAGGRRTAVERHQTLRAAIDWSYELLEVPEQRLLDRLGVFAGGFTLDAAENIAAGAGIEADEVLELLAALVGRSLVVAEARYSLLETIRQYAQERLDDAGDADRIRRQHAAYYAAFAERVVPTLAGPDEIEATQSLDREVDNLRAALSWAIDTQDIDTALRLAGMEEISLIATDAGAALRAGAEAALTIPGASEHPKCPAALVAAAWDAAYHGDHEHARRRCDEAITAEQRLGIDPTPNAWEARTFVAMASGNVGELIEPADHAATLCRARGDEPRLVVALFQVATGRAFIGESTAAIPKAEEAVALARRVASPSLTAAALAAAGFALGDSHPQRALALLREAIEVSARRKRGPLGQTWAVAGHVAATQGKLRDALTFYGNALDELHWLGHRPVLGAVLARVGDLVADADPEAAAVLHGAGDALAPEFVIPPATAKAHEHALATLETSLDEGQRHELQAQGTAMNENDAVAYAHAAINRLLDH